MPAVDWRKPWFQNFVKKQLEAGNTDSPQFGSAQDGLLPKQLRIPVARPQRVAG